MRDLGLLSETTMLSYTKVRKEKIRNKHALSIEHNNSMSPLVCICFDGRKDDTVTISDRGYRSVAKEEHNVVIKEPGATYIDHIHPEVTNAYYISR